MNIQDPSRTASIEYIQLPFYNNCWNSKFRLNFIPFFIFISAIIIIWFSFLIVFLYNTNFLLKLTGYFILGFAISTLCRQKRL